MKSIKNILIAMAVIAFSACSNTEKWSVEGDIAGAEGQTVYLESVNNGRWSAVDSTEVASNGSFKFTREKASYPDIFRLTLDGRSLYFPIDSIENITVSGNLADFDARATIAGSPSAELMQQINDRIARDGKSLPDSLLKRDIANMLQNDWGSIVAYYAINKTIGNMPLYDPALSFDRRIINAVANAYDTQKPDDPRSRMLRENSLNNRRMFGDQTTTVVAEEIPFLEISLPDKTGKNHSLTEEWQKGKVVVINFTLYAGEQSPAYNTLLADIYGKYSDRGLEIYQIDCGSDEHFWLQVANNLPWVSVFNSPADKNASLLRYNIQSLPTTFIIDRTGAHFDRIDDISTLDAAIAKYI